RLRSARSLPRAVGGRELAWISGRIQWGSDQDADCQGARVPAANDRWMPVIALRKSFPQDVVDAGVVGGRAPLFCQGGEQDGLDKAQDPQTAGAAAASPTPAR